MSNRRRLPSLQALAVFEAVGRKLSFSAAAEELGIGQPAVSQRIAALEDELGTQLFRRLHRGVAFTVEGEHLFHAVREGLARIRDTVDGLARRKERVLTVVTDFGFAAWWLMPRLEAFRQLYPDVEVRVLTGQDEVAAADGSPDIAIRFGPGAYPDSVVTLLFPEVVVPVCAPSLLGEGQDASLAAIATLPLLHLEPPQPNRWMIWPEVLDARLAAARDRRHDLTFNNYQLLLQAALKGQGVALGWRPLIDPFLADGQLVALTDTPFRTARGYFLIEPKTGRHGRPAADFRRWLMEEAGRHSESIGVPMTA